MSSICHDLQPMVATVPRSVLAPSFNSRVTGPDAPDQVMVNAWPSVRSYALFVRVGVAMTWEMAAEMARKRAVKYILVVLCEETW